MRACPMARAAAGVLALGWTAIDEKWCVRQRMFVSCPFLVVPRPSREHCVRSGPQHRQLSE
eukprot:13791372-Heterocapsa_arctica.AAC.1